MKNENISLTIKRPVKVRAALARTAAHWFLKNSGILAPPVPVLKLLKGLAKIYYFYNKQESDFAREEGFSLIDEDGNYRVYLNFDLPAGRDNFTYGHEAGHIVLKHHKEFDIGYLNDKENKILDREADIFSSELLMPKEWVYNAVQRPITVREIGRLKDLFGVSWTAMINRLDELNISSKEDCGRLFIEWKQMECQISAAVNIKIAVPKIKNSKVIKMGNFKFPPMDDNMRFTECPICGNKDFSLGANYCKKCGQYLYNTCTAPDEFCGQKNVSDALYCEYCGTKTSMYLLLEELGLLDKFKVNQKDELEVPF